MTDPRIFSVEEVQDLIPRLANLIGEQISLQTEIERGLGELAQTLGTMPENLDEESSDTDSVRRMKDALRQRILRYERGWRSVEELGAVVKDPRTGLLDFYGRIDGKVVWLCWRYGEPALDWYHDLDAGFAGRRPLAGEARKRHLN